MNPGSVPSGADLGPDDTTALDLFAGPGGWDEGIRELGIEPLGVEWDVDTCLTRQAAGHRTLQADVAALEPDDFRTLDGRAPDLLLASPPCQAFSVAGKKKGTLDRDLILEVMRDLARGEDTRAAASARANDERAMLVVEPLRWALALRPRFVAFEQVPPVLALWEHMAEYLEHVGYHTWTGKVYAEEYGVPQTRRRAILLASLEGPVAPPTPTHHRYDPRASERPSGDGLETWVSMADALGWPSLDLVGFPRRADHGETVTLGGVDYRARDLRAASEPAFNLTEKARSWMRYLEAARDPDAPESADPLGLKGLDWPWRRPATTVAGDPRVFQPGGHHTSGEQSRNAVRVTVEEASVLQSFPADYPWRGARTSQYLQVGNAVPPLMARAIVDALAGASAAEQEAA